MTAGTGHTSTEPGCYRVVVRGRISEHLTTCFEQLELESHAGESCAGADDFRAAVASEPLAAHAAKGATR